MTNLGMAADPYLTDTKNYEIDAAIADNGTTFILTATAKSTQLTNDPDCTTLTINEIGKKSGESTTCWEK